MRPLAARDRHRAQHLSASAALAFALVALPTVASVVGCSGGSLPAPRHVQVVAEDYIPIPFAPRPPPVEIVPPRPVRDDQLVWADGGWEWSGDRFRWDPGAWLIPPPGAVRARWVIVRRVVDGQLFLAPSSWRDASGKPIDPPKPLARASTRPLLDLLPSVPARTDLDE